MFAKLKSETRHLSLGLVFLALPIALSAQAEPGALPSPSMEIKIWNGSIPGAIENPGEEKQEAKGRVSNVSVPTLDVYLPAPERANGTAIIVCSGGGYVRLAARPLGQYAAQKFLPLGITVFSLKYRVKPPSTRVKEDALADVQQAVRLVRSRAKEWNINPDRIGLVGFSAGAHLILNLAGHVDAGDPQAADPLAKISCRPDFIGLFATWSGGDALEAFQIDDKVPPAFLSHTRDDSIAPIVFAEKVAGAWEAAKRPVSLEVYDQGGHEAFNFPNALSGVWPDKFLTWLRGQNLLSPVPVGPE